MARDKHGSQGGIKGPDIKDHHRLIAEGAKTARHNADKADRSLSRNSNNGIKGYNRKH